MQRRVLAGLIVVLTLTTAAVHLYVGIASLIAGARGPGVILALNGLGFVGLMGLLFVAARRFPARVAPAHYPLIGYTALTFVLYFVLNGFVLSPAAGVSKLAEFLLIVVLGLHLAGARR